MDDRRVLLYGDVNLNIIDGSAIWLVSMAEVLVRAGARVTLVLKARIENDRLVAQLTRLDGVRIVSTTSDGLTPRFAARAISAEFARDNYDAVIVRGLRACRACITNEKLANRLWAYITDVPDGAPGEALESIQAVASSAQVLFAQTEDARALIETVAPTAAGKTLLLPPMIPDHATPIPRRPGESLRAVYAGKMARAWNTAEICGLPQAFFAETGKSLELTVIGDKVQEDPRDATWSARMQALLDDPGSDTRALGGIDRAASMREIARHDLGISWRDATLDSSHEISTKVLEYAMLGVPPVLNDTAAHRRLFGEDYPLYVSDELSVVRALEWALNNPSELDLLRRHVYDAVQPYSMREAAQRLDRYLNRYASGRSASAPLRVVVAGHDFKFASDIFSALSSDDFEVRVDKWDTLHSHDEERSRECLQWADVIFCEWAGPNAVWYSRNVDDGKRLIVRLHGFELRGRWIRDMRLENVDTMVFVSEAYAEKGQSFFSDECVNIQVVHNSVDVVDLHRDKIDGAQFHLGIMGVVPMIKRLDRAVDLLEDLLAHDDRFVLHVRGRAPWDYPWEWKDAVQRDAYEQVVRRLDSPQLRDHVALEPFAPDVGNWFRRIGWILSPSDRETFHLAGVEGMASGAVPVIWDRAGASEIFGDSWIVRSREEAADAVLAAVRTGAWAALSRECVSYAARYDVVPTRSSWRALLSRQVPALGARVTDA